MNNPSAAEVENRFTAMFRDNGIVPSVKKKKNSAVDFGASMANDTTIADTFRLLHNQPLNLPAPVDTGVDAETNIVDTTSDNKPDNQPDNESSNESNNGPDNQAINQADNEPSDEADNQTINIAIIPTIKQTTEQPAKQSNNQTSKQSAKQCNKQSVEQSILNNTKQSTKQSPDKSARYKWLPLNENQGKILLFLYEKGGGLTNMDNICVETAIAYGTARAGIDVLVSEGYITGKSRHNGHAFKGFEYSLNNHLCSLYVSRIRSEQSDKQSLQQSIEQSHKQTIKQTVSPFSSSFLDLEKELTTKETGILDEPELRFWRSQGVTEKQVAKWMAEFDLSQDQISLYLRYCRFEIIEKDGTKDAVKSPPDWFYRRLDKVGDYKKPHNYRSLLDIRAEALQQQQEADKQSKAKIAELEFENSYQAFLSDTSAPLYQQLMDQVSAFAKEQMNDGERMYLDIELRDFFLAKNSNQSDNQ